MGTKERELTEKELIAIFEAGMNNVNYKGKGKKKTINVMKKIIIAFIMLFSITAMSQESVQIGDQIWMKSNLNTSGGVCYGNNPSNCFTMGGLYTWEQAMAGSTEEGAQGVCPSGWHIPTLAEVEVLYTTLGGQSVAAPKMKMTGKWEFARATCTPQPTNESKFCAIPAGTRFSTGTFIGGTNTTMWWTSTRVEGTLPNDDAAYYFGVRYCSTDGKIGQLYTNPIKAQAISVRCIKD